MFRENLATYISTYATADQDSPKQAVTLTVQRFKLATQHNVFFPAPERRNNDARKKAGPTHHIWVLMEANTSQTDLHLGN